MQTACAPLTPEELQRLHEVAAGKNLTVTEQGAEETRALRVRNHRGETVLVSQDLDLVASYLSTCRVWPAGSAPKPRF